MWRDGARREAARRLHRAIDVGTPFDLVLDVALLLETAEDGAHGDLLEVTLARYCLVHGIPPVRGPDAHTDCITSCSSSLSAGRVRFRGVLGSMCYTL